LALKKDETPRNPLATEQTLAHHDRRQIRAGVPAELAAEESDDVDEAANDIPIRRLLRHARDL